MISLIAAMSKNRVIGKDGRLPWSLPDDLAYFKKITMGHPVIMGRKTFESLGKPLPGRENIVITENRNYQPKDCLTLHSIDETIAFCNDKNGFIIGGAQIYRQFLPYAEKLYITFIDEIFDGDSFFPEVNLEMWRLISQTKGKRNEQNPYEYYFLIYVKELQ
jgi:dihydrofolate reductase